MILGLKELGNAISKMDKLSSDNPRNRQVLLDVDGSEVYVVYSDGKKSIVEKIEAQVEEGDIKERAILGIDKIKEVLEACSGRGNLKCDEVHISFDGTDQMVTEALKYTVRQRNGEEVKKIDSRINKNYKYIKADNLKNGSLLTRFNYRGVYQVMDMEGISVDNWSINELKNVLSKVSKNEPKTCFISSKINAAFCVAQAHMTYVPIAETISCGFSVTPKVARCLSDIIGSIEGAENMSVTVLDDRYCYMVDDSEKVGILFENTPATRMDKSTLDRYTNMRYESYSVVFNRETLTDAVVRAKMAGKDDQTTLKFRLEAEKYVGEEDADSEVEALVAYIERGDKLNGYTDVTAQAEEYSSGDDFNIVEVKLVINLNVFNSLLDNCTDEFVIMSFNELDNNVFTQLTDCHTNEDGDIITTANHYTIVQLDKK